MIIPKLNLSDNYTRIENKSIVKARNVILDDNFEYLKEEKGFTHKHTFVNNICGVVATPDKDVVLCTDDQSVSEIYTVNDSTKTLILKGDLGFSTNYPIKGEYQYNSLGELIVVLNDTEHPLWCINIDDVENIISLDPSKNILDNSEIVKLRLTPDFNMPNIEMFDPIEGSLPKGIYQIVVSYYIGNNDNLNWSLPSKTITIGKREYLDFYYYASYESVFLIPREQKDGDIRFTDRCQKAGANISNQGIRARVLNLDSRYNKFKAALIYTTTTTTKVYDIGNFEIDNSQDRPFKDIYISDIPEKELSLDEVTIPYISYNKVQDITNFDSTLYTFGLTNNSEFDYQKYANNIKVTYEVKSYYKDGFGTREVTESDNDDIQDFGDINVVDMTQNKTVMLNEVYALNIGLIGKDGIIKGWYHIPGRKNKGIEKEKLYSTVFNERTLNYKIYNTAANSTDSDRYLSYWENETETYPNLDHFDVYDVDLDGNGFKIDTIRNTNVRHHKTPSFDKIYTADGKKANKLVGLSFENIKFPKEIRDNIQGYVIGYIPRSSNDMTILGQYPMMHNDFYLNTTNHEDHLEGLVDLYKNPDYKLGYRFNDLNILTNKPSFTRPFVSKMYNSITGNKYNVDCTKVDEIVNTIHGIEKVEYLPRDNYATNPNNKGREETLFLQGYIPNDNYYGDKCTTIELRDDKSNVYLNLANRRVAIASDITYINSTSYSYNSKNLFDFDCHLNSYYDVLFRGDQSITLDESNDEIENIRNDGDLDDNMSTVFTALNVFSYSVMDASYKEVDMSNSNYEWVKIRFMGKNERYRIYSNLQIDPKEEPIISYDNTYSKVNNIKATYVTDLIAVKTSSFPYRVARSLKQSKEAINLNWRKFSALEYYEMPKHRGPGIVIESAGRKLLIHHEHSLFVASIKDRLKSEQGDAYIGVADIFEYPPEELLYAKTGKAGIQSRFGYTLGEDGYIFVDLYEPGLYKYSNEGYDVLSDRDIREFFNKYIIPTTNGNPLKENDVLVMHDEKTKRIILTNKGSNPFTLSYCYASKSWISFHDYIPSLMYNTRRGIYGISQNLKEIYKFNDGEYATYFNGQFYQSFVDVLLNDSPTRSKELNSIGIQSGVNGEENRIDSLFFYTKNQCSNVITLEEWDGLEDYDKIRYIENYWNYSFIRDYTSNYIEQSIVDDFGNINQDAIFNDKMWYELSPFVDRFFIIRLISNTSKEVIFRDVKYNATLMVR